MLRRSTLWFGSQMSWPSAVAILFGVFLGSCLTGCAVGTADNDLVASQVKTLEGDDVDVTSCDKVGEAITRESEYGASLNEAWMCAVKSLDDVRPAEVCYAVNNGLELGVIGRLKCSSLRPGCPPGGRRLKGGNVFLGPIIHPDLVLQRERGNSAAYRTIRVDVSHDNNGAAENCGYLSVQLPIDAEDPLKLAAERVEAHGWSQQRYSFSSRSVD